MEFIMACSFIHDLEAFQDKQIEADLLNEKRLCYVEELLQGEFSPTEPFNFLQSLYECDEFELERLTDSLQVVLKEKNFAIIGQILVSHAEKFWRKQAEIKSQEVTDLD